MGKAMATAAAKAGITVSLNSTNGVLKLAGGNKAARAKLVQLAKRKGARVMDEKHDSVWLSM